MLECPKSLHYYVPLAATSRHVDVMSVTNGDCACICITSDVMQPASGTAAGVMYTCDAFGAHYCQEDPFDTALQPLAPHFRFYYDCLMRPNARSVLTALRKTQDLAYTTIATGHGPILRYNMQELVGRCTQRDGGYPSSSLPFCVFSMPRLEGMVICTLLILCTSLCPPREGNG